MRSSYTEDEDFAGQFALWQANCTRSLHGKKGRAALHELEAALLALPEKRLIADTIATEAGEVCAVGALLAARRCERGASRAEAIATLLDRGEDETTEDAAAEDGVPRLVAWKLVTLNDMDLENCTPEQRYVKVLAWVRARLAE